MAVTLEAKLPPVFDRNCIRWTTDQRCGLVGLGIPPEQDDGLAGGKPMADVLRARLEKLACDFPLEENYFAWQAFGRGYGKGAAAPLPPFLQPGIIPRGRPVPDGLRCCHGN